VSRIFFGGEGLRAGWGILLFVVLCFGLYYAINRLHVLPAQPPATPGQPSPELPPVASILGEGVMLALVSLATLLLSRIERRPIGVYGLGGSGRLRLFLQGLFWGFVLLSLLVLVLWQAHLLVFDRLLLAPRAILRYAAVWAFGFLFVALFEETFLRGYLQFTLTRGLSALYRPFTTPRRAASLRSELQQGCRLCIGRFAATGCARLFVADAFLFGENMSEGQNVIAAHDLRHRDAHQVPQPLR
jgi:membrane protease YdiL (CAAX protease family)